MNVLLNLPSCSRNYRPRHTSNPGRQKADDLRLEINLGYKKCPNPAWAHEMLCEKGRKPIPSITYIPNSEPNKIKRKS